MKNGPRSCERNLCNCVRSLKKIWDFDEIWTRDLVILLRRSNQLCYEATDVGSWSIMCSYVPVKKMNVIEKSFMSYFIDIYHVKKLYNYIVI